MFNFRSATFDEFLSYKINSICRHSIWKIQTFKYLQQISTVFIAKYLQNNWYINNGTSCVQKHVKFRISG